MGPMTSRMGSGAKWAAAVTGSLGREGTGSSPMSGQGLAGRVIGGVRALDSLAYSTGGRA